MVEKGQIVIVGAGPTGLMAANLLGKAGVATLLLEQHTGLSNEPRAITIDDEGLRICQAIGLADAVEAQLQPDISAYYVSRNHLLARVAPQQQPNGYPLISTFYQPDFEAALLQGLERFPHVEVRFEHTVEDLAQDADGVMLTVSTPDGARQHIRSAYVLACDGGKSRLRQASGIALRPPQLRDLFLAPSMHASQPVKARKRPGHPTQRWLVIDYSDHNKPSKRITFYCNPARPAVSVQAPQTHRRWEFMLKPSEQEKDFLDEKAITAMIKQAEATLPESLQITESEPVQINRKVVYRFYATIATAFSRGRVFLVGDAAHLMPPFGGQGMNSGLRDAYNLCWKLKLVMKGQASDHLLASYQQERYPHVAQMILFSSLLGRLIMPTNPLLACLRDIFFRSIGQLPFVRVQFTEMRVKPQPRYGEGYLLATKYIRLVGRQLPQPYVLQNGIRVRFDEVLGDDFVLLRLYEDPAEAFTVLRDEKWARLNVRFICVQPRLATRYREYYSDSGSVRDCDSVLEKFLRKQRDLFVLVRPDRYVMGAFHVKHIEKVRQVLQSFLDK